MTINETLAVLGVYIRTMQRQPRTERIAELLDYAQEKLYDLMRDLEDTEAIIDDEPERLPDTTLDDDGA